MKPNIISQKKMSLFFNNTSNAKNMRQKTIEHIGVFNMNSKIFRRLWSFGIMTEINNKFMHLIINTS